MKVFTFWMSCTTSRLYDFHPDGQEDLLIDTMKMLKYTGDPWEDVFKAEVST